VWNNIDAAVAAAHSVEVDPWRDGFGEVIDKIAPRFRRHEPLRHAAALMQGMLSGLDRKNCPTIAEHRGHTSPDRLQHLLSRAKVGRRRGPRRPARLRGRPLRRPRGDPGAR
jgi:hypothetical protein